MKVNTAIANILTCNMETLPVIKYVSTMRESGIYDISSSNVHKYDVNIPIYNVILTYMRGGTREGLLHRFLHSIKVYISLWEHILCK